MTALRELDPNLSAHRQPFGCSVTATLAVMGGRWKPLILFKLLEHGPLRFNALRRLAPQATAKILAQQLRELERDGVLARTVYPEAPPRVEYALTGYGATLAPILEAMRAWGAAHMRRSGGDAARS